MLWLEAIYDWNHLIERFFNRYVYTGERNYFQNNVKDRFRKRRIQFFWLFTLANRLVTNNIL